MRIRIGVDIGGTFTDCVAVDDRGRLVAHRKEASTLPEVERGALAAIDAVAAGVAGIDHVVHGTTVATNALIEGRTARVGLLTTEGFRDVLAIGTQMRPDLYDVMQRRPDPLVPRHLRLEVVGRLAPDGTVVRPLDEDSVRRAVRRLRRERVEAVAVCLLFSYVDDAQERRVAELVREELPGVEVALSSEIAPLIREYPRTSSTVVNAALRPLLGGYLRRFERSAGAPVLVLQSGGGVLPAAEAAREGHRLVASGPAAGVVGAGAFARAHGFADVVTMDMGGTSFDTCLVLGGRPNVRPETTVAGHPVLSSTVDLVTVGAGGGSLAAVDAGGALTVGPASAGAVPGPACSGRGGRRATVTDANVVTGRIDPERFLDGRLPLDVDAARRAIADDVAARLGVGVEEAALAILEVATATMARALRVVTVGRGRDPAELPLVAFGGAGPLAAAALAQDVGAPAVLVPPLAGFVSALGLLSTDLRTEVARTVPGSGTRPVEEDALGAVAGPMVEEAVRRLGGPEGASVAFAVDCRYAGQGFELTVPLPTLDGQGIAAARTGFHAAHDAVFGHSAVEEPVEVVALRVIATAPGASFVPAELEGERGSSDEPASVRKVFVAGGWIETPVYERTALGAGWSAEGPLLVDEGESTAWVPRGWSVAVDAFGSMALEPTGGSGGR